MCGSSDPSSFPDRLAAATNAHDIDALVACFAEDYLNETPAHPPRGFRGVEQVRRNWTQLFAGMPDLTARVLATAVEGNTVWSEWEMSGRRTDGTVHLMRGVIIFGVRDGKAACARFTWSRWTRPAATSTPRSRGPPPARDPAAGRDSRRRRHRDPRLTTGADAHRPRRHGPGADPRRTTRRPVPRYRCRHRRRRRTRSVDRRRGCPRLHDRHLGDPRLHRTAWVDPASIDRDGNRTLIRAALGAGVDHLVLVSVYGAAPTHPMSLHRMKYDAEQSLIDSGLNWTIIRPVPFMETWIDVIGAHLADQGKALVPGPGNNLINIVSVRDIATIIDSAIRDDTLRSQTLDVTGPESLTFRHIAEQLIAINAKPGRIVHIPLVALRVMSVLATPVAPAFARRAQAAVIMNTTDMTAAHHTTPPRHNSTGLGTTTLGQLLQLSSQR